ncbi:TadE/TadG family type IV pilus assembly protein [Methylobacterium sp. NEAU K]|uniref:TadE/TadG family type IV pilus assembly protein n=1 Tax=Methylobacterium sp. NEAU K TaxID=3064946 RepID=UPI0027342C01|nr:TadE/TadG family type IV pilus assembly protein [Methylobacterium sp. NEAU K]MDP4004494.1 pilus assembly protein TadG-related protein [Methylobacterium sp. NEAU K]
MARHPDRTRRPWRSGLARDRGGNVAILFAFLSVPMLMFTGAAIDYGFATRLETKLQAATDATALLLCQTPLATTATSLNTLAQTAMIGAMGSANLVVDPLTITSNPRQITLTAHKLSTVFFGKFTGTASINPGARAQCATPLPKTFEIALVLDNTGSMAEASGGQSKLQAVQTAATNFVNYVYTNAAFSSATRISIVPFAGAVAVDPTAYRYAGWIDQNGQSSYHWTNVSSPNTANFKSRFDIFTALQSAYSGWSWAGCLETLPYPLNVQDGAPTSSNKDSYYVPLLAPDEPGNGSTSYAGYPTNNPTAYSFNSYIDDSNGTGSCGGLSNNTSYFSAEGRACKYLNARNASPTSSNSSTGIPNGPNFGCTTKPLQRLTSNTTTLKNLIGSMAPLGSTNIHEGFMWGWRTLSPNSVFADGSAYASSSSSSNTNTVNKIIILMTDGTNSWTANPYSQNGSLYFASAYFQNTNGTTPNPRLPPSNQNISDATSARSALDALTAQACANAKAVNISIYTIGFSIPSDPIDAAGQTLLKNCASSSNQFFLANTADDLIGAFQQIQASIGALRLTQ